MSTPRFYVVWGSDEAGVFDARTHRQVASSWSLRRIGLPEACTLARYSDAAIARVVDDHEYRWAARRRSYS